MSIPTAEDTATVRFAWREIGNERELGTAFIPQVVLPILDKRVDAPRLEAELSRLLAECPGERRDIEAALALVRSCATTPGTELLAVAH